MRYLFNLERMYTCIYGTRAKPNIRVDLKGNAKYVYHQQLSMSTCTYKKDLLVTVGAKRSLLLLAATSSSSRRPRRWTLLLLVIVNIDGSLL
jgi:hypothetical protein